MRVDSDDDDKETVFHGLSEIGTAVERTNVCNLILLQGRIVLTFKKHLDTMNKFQKQYLSWLHPPLKSEYNGLQLTSNPSLNQLRLLTLSTLLITQLYIKGRLIMIFALRHKQLYLILA